MNKRIQELAEQCTTIYNSTAFPVDKDFDYEKFAELIVKECISKLEEEIYQSIDNEGDEIWPDLILNKHFGVK